MDYVVSTRGLAGSHSIENRALLRPDCIHLFAVRVLNIDAIAVAFGSCAAGQVSEAVCSSLRAVLDECDFDGTVNVRSCGAFDLIIERNWFAATKFEDAESVYQRLDRWCRNAALAVYSADGTPILAAISLRKARQFFSSLTELAVLDQAHSALLFGVSKRLEAPQDDGVYANEMRWAVAWAEDFVAGQLALAWVPVRNLRDDAVVVHHHGQLCAMSSSGAILDPARRQAAIRWLGLAATLDLAVLGKALELASRSVCQPLVVDISASTLRSSLWQISHLLDSMKVGDSDRIRIQIIPDIDNVDEQVAAGIAELHQRGIKLGVEICRPNALRRPLMLSIRPQFVAIAPMFMRSILARPGNIESVSTICALAQLIAPMVVMQGIDTPLLAEHARSAGVEWGEGEYLGAPSWQTPRHAALAGPDHGDPQEHSEWL